MLVFCRLAEPDRVAFTGATARRRVVLAAGIGGDTRHHPALVGNQPRSKLDVGRALDAQRILRTVSFGEVVGAIQQRIDRLLALAVDDPQGLPLLQHARPRPFRGDVESESQIRGDGIGHSANLLQAYSRSVKAKARMPSGEAVRHRSSLFAAGTRCLISVTAPPPDCEGLSGCAQLETATIRFISARRSTKSPARLRPSFQRKRPASSSATGAKNVMQGEISRTPSPILETAARKFSCVLRPLTPDEASTEAGVEPPTRRSCDPQVSSISENTARPISDRITRPFEIAALHCTLMVSAQLSRSDGSSSRHASSDTLAQPASSMIRSASPRRRSKVVYQPNGTVSRWITASGAIGAPLSAVGSGNPFGVNSCPAARSSS